MAGKGDIKKDEIQPKLNPSWKTIKFEEVIVKTTITHKLKSNSFYHEGLFPVVDQGSALVAGYVNDSDVLYKGDLPIVVFGDHTRNIKFIDFDFAIGADGTKILKPRKGIDVKFLFYYLKSLRVPDFGYSRHYSVLKFLDFPVPPLAEQERIVAKLDILFAQHEAMKKALESIPQLLKDFRQQVLTQAVSGKLTEEWRKKHSTEEWVNGKLADVIEYIESGKSFNCPSVPVKPGNVGLVKISAVTWGFFDERETKTVVDKNKINERLFINKGDFLISRANTLELVGAPVIVDEIKNKIMLNDKIWRVVFNNQETKCFVNYFLKSDVGRKEIEAIASGNQLSMRNISQGKFKEISMKLPSLEEQMIIGKKIASLFDKADKIEAKCKLLKTKVVTIPQAILYKAFKGELVKQLSTDGDAKELLNEILKLKES